MAYQYETCYQISDFRKISWDGRKDRQTDRETEERREVIEYIPSGGAGI